jgi:hypothetical protein
MLSKIKSNCLEGRTGMLQLHNPIKSYLTRKIYENNIKSFMKLCNVKKLELLVIMEFQKQIIKYLMIIRERGYQLLRIVHN